MIESGMPSEKRILIIERNLNAAKVFKSNLENLNEDLNISILRSAEEAILELKLSSIDLVISNVRLPGMSGIELLTIVKRISPKTKIFVVSGSSDDGIKKQSAAAGADAFFYKPVDIPEFLDAVERSLGLISTVLTPELQLETAADEEDHIPGLPGKLIVIKRKLSAQAVFLLGKSGRILISEGELPKNKFKSSFIPRLGQLIQMCENISEELNTLAPKNLHVFRIAGYDILSIQYESAYILLIVIPKDKIADLSSVYQTTDTLFNILKTLGVTTKLDTGTISDLSFKEYEKIENEPETDDSLLEEALNSEVNPEDADSFWDEPNPQKTVSEGGSGSLSYDQANDLGLKIQEE